MNPKDIAVLNKLEREAGKQLDKIIEFYKARRITIDDLLGLAENNLKISAVVLNRFAVRLSDGKNDLDVDKENAQRLFEYAGQLGSAWGLSNAGKGYLNGLGVKANLKKGIELLEQARLEFNDHKEFHGDFYIALAYEKRNNFKRALQYYRQVPPENEASYPKAQQKIRELLSQQLNDTYQRIEAMDTDAQPEEMEVKEAHPKPGWTSLSEVHDGYAPNAAASLLTDLHLAGIEHETAEQAVASVSRHLDDVEMHDAPKPTIVALKKRKRELETAEENTQLKLKKAKTSHEKAAEEKEFKRQVQTEKHYFAARRTKAVISRDKALELQANRLRAKTEKTKTVVVDDVPARQMITAELATIEASQALLGKPERDYDTDYGWTVKEQEDKRTYYIYKGNTERIKLSGVQFAYQQRTNPHANHTGDYHMHELGTYTHVLNAINFVTGTTSEDTQTDKEKQMAIFMLRYSKTGQGLTLSELQAMNADTKEEDLRKINRIFYHTFVKEPARWMQPRDADHEVPWATAQARAVKLIEAGHLKMVDVFKQFAPYGVFTGQNIGEAIELVKEKVRKINLLYQERILKPAVLSAPSYTVFFNDHKNGDLVSTRKQLHKELQETYGGDNDTDGEGYDSDTAEKLYSSSGLTFR